MEQIKEPVQFVQQLLTADSNAPGKVYIKVSGVLGVIFNTFAAAAFLFFVAAIYLIPAKAWEIVELTLHREGHSITADDLKRYGLLIAAVALSLVVVQLVIYIIGIVCSSKPNRAGLLKVLGTIAIILQIAGGAVGIVMSCETYGLLLGGMMGVTSLAIGLVLPVLYTVGAFKNGRAKPCTCQ